MLKFVFLLLVGYVSCAKVKVIIIGSGAAGIAAASRLLDNNIADFKILEAEDRIGGRIHSFYAGNAIVDIGAQYVHGQRGNLVYELARNNIIHGTEYDDIAIYYSGKLRTGDDLLTTFERIALEEDKNNNFNTLAEMFLYKFNTTVLQNFLNNPEMTAYARNFLRLAESFFLSMEGASSWHKPAAIGTFDGLEGDQTGSWQGRGFKTILDVLLKGRNINNKIFLDKKVSKIQLLGDCVKVECEDGSQHFAEHVLFTPSLGVLKYDHERLFRPRLSEAKRRVIENLGFDGTMKVVFEFQNAWWGNRGEFSFVWSDKDRRDILREIPFGPVQNGDHWLTWFFNTGKAPNNTNVLIGWIVGPMVPEIEKLTEEEMTRGTMHVFRKFLGRDYAVTDPVRVTHSKWSTNPNFRGSYSYESAGLRKKNILEPHRTLSEPVYGVDGVPRILFAGEHTSSNRYTTVDGAIATGFREADRLIPKWRKFVN